MSRGRLGRDRACPSFRTDPSRGGSILARHVPAPPLRLWRVVTPRSLGPATARSLRVTLAGVAPPFGPKNWDALLRGEPAAMARVAITFLPVVGPANAEADGVASALLMRALAGDRTAPMILAAVLRKLASLHPDDTHLAVLAGQWAAWVARTPAQGRAWPGLLADHDT